MYNDLYLEHHGVLGQKWGVRRYQKADGTRTSLGKKHEQELDDGGNEKHSFSAKATAHKVAAGIYNINAKTYAKSNKTLSSMNAAERTKQLKKAEEAQKAADAKSAAKSTAKAEAKAKKEAYKNVDPDRAKNKTTRRVALDYNNLTDTQFKSKYKTTKDKFAKRYDKTDGDTYSLGKKKAAAAALVLATIPAHSVNIGNGKKLVVGGKASAAKCLAGDFAQTAVTTHFGYKKAEKKYADNH